MKVAALASDCDIHMHHGGVSLLSHPTTFYSKCPALAFVGSDDKLTKVI